MRPENHMGDLLAGLTILLIVLPYGSVCKQMYLEEFPTMAAAFKEPESQQMNDKIRITVYIYIRYARNSLRGRLKTRSSMPRPNCVNFRLSETSAIPCYRITCSVPCARFWGHIVAEPT